MQFSECVNHLRMLSYFVFGLLLIARVVKSFEPRFLVEKLIYCMMSFYK